MAVGYFTVGEAAQLVRRSEKTVYRAIHAGRLRAYMLGRGYLIRPEDLAAWVESQVVRAPSTGEQAPAPVAPPEIGSLAMLRAIERAA